MAIFVYMATQHSHVQDLNLVYWFHYMSISHIPLIANIVHYLLSLSLSSYYKECQVSLLFP